MSKAYFLSERDPRFRKQLALKAEGMCPNGCAPLPDRDEFGNAICPKCGTIVLNIIQGARG
ncbi:hypothetical protein LCGC14_1303100 [marine sediment metagenome]|uniref:Uncharacterized protein n=2 Tax=marine sediment metagenome TaxID=412755 RepID=A0A0F9NRZ3_9ZZZZ